MIYQSPAEFRAEYAKSGDRATAEEFAELAVLEDVSVVSENADEARVEARWHISGHDPDSGYYDVVERTVFVLAQRSDGWHLHSTENLPWE
jgi:ketosteroid isomerase-like protein